MLRIIIILLCLLHNDTGFATDKEHEKLKQEIEVLNDNHQYELSIRKLEEIITNPNTSNYDLYNAYIQKYLTYKRLFNYIEALNNLDLALKAGIKSDKKGTVIKRVRIERMFVHFDLLEFDKVAALLKLISREDFNTINKETEAFYLSVLGTMSNRAKEYYLALQYLDEALIILKEHAPKHLPLIYRKKIEIYRHLNQYDKAIENFEKGLACAREHKMDIYIIAMYNDVAIFYSEIGDVESALRTEQILNRLITDYDVTNRSGKLHMVERELLKNENKGKEKQNSKIKFIIIGFCILIIIVTFIGYYFYKLNNTGRTKSINEHLYLQNDVENSIQNMDEWNLHNVNSSDYNLTDRQLEIIKLVKEGKTNKEIGTALFISENTVKYHLKVIYKTLNVIKRSDL